MVRFLTPKQSQQRIFVVLYEIFKEHRFLWAIIIMFRHPYHIFKNHSWNNPVHKISSIDKKIPVTTRVAGYILNVKVSNSGDVLCFGDSSTWGYNPKDGSRFPWGVRWTSALQEQLKDQAKQFAPDSKNLLISPIFLENGSGKKDLIRNFRRNS